MHIYRVIEMQGIVPGASRMLSERSTIYVTYPFDIKN
jgi:hypothetical protein